MSTEQINEELAFLRKYVVDLEGMDETIVQQLTAINKTKKEVINYFLSIISDYEALLGQNLRKKRAKRFQGTTVNR